MTVRALLTIFTLTIFLLTSCGGGGDSQTVTIGVLNSQSGALESFGPALEESLRIAEEEINERLSHEGSSVSIKFEFEDTGTDPAMALEKLASFDQRGIRVVIGPVSSAELVAVKQYSTEHGIVLISPSSTAEDLAQADDLILRTVAPDRGQAAAIGAAFRHFGTRFYCPIWRADDYGDDLTLLVAQAVQRMGGRFAPGSRYATSTQDFSSAIRQLEIQIDAFRDSFGLRAAAVYAVAFDEVLHILREANNRTLLKGIQWYGSDGIALNVDVFKDGSVLEFMEASRMLSPIFSGDRGAPDFMRLREKIESKVGRKVRPYALLGYDAALLIARAFDQLHSKNDAQNISGTGLRDEILAVSRELEGVTGSLALDENGDRMPGSYEYWRITRSSDGSYAWTLAAIFDVPDLDYGRGTYISVNES